ncbi:2-Hacid_dh_C domain-containing protein [Mucor velutinosus]|uniref:Vacuolar-sorting protein SNF7 n=2 Tax=Mucor TaxID=4830 RepID=A0A0C9LWE0_9FUNG|nr:2-Hacid_dh_C domain-containing protein [Mucor velutinosus]GAN08360.1 snf7-domain-containing protein [Mucor ambiguus]
MNLFFGKAKSKTTAKDAIYKLRETLGMLEKRQTFLETKAENELKIAKANATKNKRAALMALKRKKTYEANIEKINGARMTIETQMMAIENANVNLETMGAMRAGAEAMKNIHGSMDIDKVDATMDDIRDQMDVANEISEAISRPVNVGDELDEDDLLNELEELEQEELDAKMLETPSPVVSAPNVPTRVPIHNVTVEEDDEEAELRALKASIAM